LEFSEAVTGLAVCRALKAAGIDSVGLTARRSNLLFGHRCMIKLSQAAEVKEVKESIYFLNETRTSWTGTLSCIEQLSARQ